MKIHYHLPGLFEFYELYKVFLPLFRDHREYFYDWCEIGSIYGAPADCIWGGGRVGFGEAEPEEVATLMKEYEISPRLTFSNSLLGKEHLTDKRCNELCELFIKKCGMIQSENGKKESAKKDRKPNGQVGIIVHSDLLLEYLKNRYPEVYFVSSTTKVLADFDEFEKELEREEFRFVVPDFRLNKEIDKLNVLNTEQKKKVEFLCNECCWFDCYDRKRCYENVSRKSLGEDCEDHICVSPTAKNGYRFSDAMNNPGFIGIDEIQKTYAPNGFTEFKIEGRSLGSAVILEFLLYYMTKTEWQLKIREEIYLDSMLDLF